MFTKCFIIIFQDEHSLWTFTSTFSGVILVNWFICVFLGVWGFSNSRVVDLFCTGLCHWPYQLQGGFTFQWYKLTMETGLSPLIQENFQSCLLVTWSSCFSMWAIKNFLCIICHVDSVSLLNTDFQLVQHLISFPHSPYLCPFQCWPNISGATSSLDQKDF